ncbi:MAG: TIGR02301 family protein [Alsobacter sp.]
MSRRGTSAALVVTAALALTMAWLSPDPASAQFFWPWNRPAAPPPPPATPQPERKPRAPRPAAKPPAAKPGEAKKEDKPGDKKDAKADAQPEPEAPPPPYEPQLLRLSEIMGALAFLRPLCGAQDGADFQRRMENLIEVEATSQSRKERLAGAYNKGYREYAQSYRRCTPAAQVIIQRYADEGGKLTRELSGRFGG